MKDERTMLEELLRETPGTSAVNVRKHLRDGDVEVSLHARIGAAIEDTRYGEPVIAAAVMLVEWSTVVPTFALGEAGAALQAAVGDDKPRKIIGQDGGRRWRGRPAGGPLPLRERGARGLGHRRPGALLLPTQRNDHSTDCTEENTSMPSRGLRTKLITAVAATLLAVGTAAELRTDAGFAVFGNEHIYYESTQSTGSGEAVVLSHGAGGSHAIWMHQTPVLAEQYRVVTWDQRGWGKSTNVAGLAGDQNTAIEDLRRLMDHLGIDKAHVIGQSMGGWVVAGFALRHPERTLSLTLANTYGGLTTEAMREWMTPERMAERQAQGRPSDIADPARAFQYRQTVPTRAAPAPDGPPREDVRRRARLGCRTPDDRADPDHHGTPRLDLSARDDALVGRGVADESLGGDSGCRAFALLRVSGVVERGGVGARWGLMLPSNRFHPDRDGLETLHVLPIQVIAIRLGRTVR